MTGLVATAVAFVVLHRLVSGSRLREVIVARTGEAAFHRGFSIASLVLTCVFWLAYRSAQTDGEEIPILAPMLSSLFVQAPLQAIAIFFILAGLTTPGPTITGMGDRLRGGDPARGVLRVTRHPFLWGVGLFSLAHMLAAPRLSAWIFFGTLLFVAMTGTVSIDAKRRRAFGQDWSRFASATSNVPFAAILAGRQTFKPGEIGWWRPTVAAIVFLAFVWLHPYFGTPSLL